MPPMTTLHAMRISLVRYSAIRSPVPRVGLTSSAICTPHSTRPITRKSAGTHTRRESSPTVSFSRARLIYRLRWSSLTLLNIGDSR
ncbi:uncharacterized protein LAESUDRAFT_733097 [Laetiporus sulphureus 93-53]|uniref:Uncharacterized protein n=1 Tax=Laetiporus sulphureus 93-53 TaxID=1314785 RepID=A0A165AR96_9APHY|nr:uncharacterized protein LAESUDRAFT_733097 [Laetiporus sulphureus 93-53]KZS99506.1 hypothetical protein LAESUDRAFT_733097 [Laetiporus sulphureus 93-53]